MNTRLPSANCAVFFSRIRYSTQYNNYTYLVHVGDHGGRERVKGYLQNTIQFPLVRLRDTVIACMKINVTRKGGTRVKKNSLVDGMNVM